jgi:N-acyl-D-amino-acid deacylase
MKLFYSTIFLVILSCSAHAQQADILIKNGKIIDGTGNSWFYGDVLIKDGKIIDVGNIKNASAKKIIDATGLIVAPGFIDVHTHIEGDEKKNPTADNFLYDGVTTVITGNCGSSHVDMGKYFSFLDSVKLSINVASLIGHNDIREAVMGDANRKPTDEELQKMKDIVAKAMQDGAVGFSTGLIYIPGTYSSTDEIVQLAKVAAQYHGVYATHMRDEGDKVTDAINEAIEVGREAKIPVEISHFKVGGQQNWGRSKETLAMVIKAREEGLDVTIDQYPYTASSTSLSTLLPDEILSDNKDSVNARLKNTAVQQQIIDYMLAKLKKRNLEHLSYAVVAYFKADTTLNGKSIEEINLLKGRKHTAVEECKTVIEMMQQGGASMVFHGMSEEDVEYIMRYPYNIPICDAGIRVFNEGSPHPRGYGTNARILGKYVREKKIMSLEEAIRRMTSLPAQKFQFKDRGLLAKGFAADVVVFDENKVKDLSTYEKPHQYSVGFKYVLVNGAVTIEDGKHNGTRNGKVLKLTDY